MDCDQMYVASGHSQTDKSITTEMDVDQKRVTTSMSYWNPVIHTKKKTKKKQFEFQQKPVITC